MTASAWDPVRRHPVAAALERLHAELDDLAEASVWSMSHDELTDSLTAATRLTARVAELELRVAAGAARRDLGAHAGATSPAAWWAHTTRQTGPTTQRRIRLAQALDGAHEPVRDALAAGGLLEDQARVIVHAIDQLPTDLVDPELAHRCEQHLIGEARNHDATALKILGRRILDVLAPEIGEAHEQRLLDEEEKQAHQHARFTLSDDGHGRSHGRFTIPTLHAEILRKHLLALAAPRHQAAGGLADQATGGLAPGERPPLPLRMGLAFCEYLENHPTDRLPDAGGVPATIVVTIDLATLLGGPHPGQLDTGPVISAGQARRLACQAGIIPAVLGGPSQVLDLGRQRRLHTKAQRTAIALRDRHCTAQGCDWPPGLCHVHHNLPWALGGHTTTTDGRLLCPRHHARAHDPAYTTTHLPDGKVAFTRRT